MCTQNPFITLSSNCRPVRVIKFVSEESIEEGIYTIALEKLRLEQDLTNEEEENNEGEGTFFLSGFESRAFWDCLTKFFNNFSHYVKSTDKNDYFTGGKRKTKRDVSRLLKIALDVDMSEEKIGDVNKVFIEQEKSYTSLWKKNT